MGEKDPGNVFDDVVLGLNGIEVARAKNYNIRQSVLSQPGEFSLTLGQSENLRELLLRAPPNTPFTLSINGHLRMTGRTDGFRMSGSESSSELSIFGRDALAPLHDAHVAADKSFTDSTYSGLVKSILQINGIDPALLVASSDKGNKVNRNLLAGVPIKELAPAKIIEKILSDLDANQAGTTTHTTTAQSLQAKVGERWYEFLRKQLDRAGLMLWATGDGRFVLSAPNTDLEPSYKILRRRGQTRNDCNVISGDYLNDTRPRFTFAIVYSRGGGRKKGRGKAKGDATDDEMVEFGFGSPIEVQIASGGGPSLLPAMTIAEINKAASAAKKAGAKPSVKVEPGFSRAMVIRDANCGNAAQAAYLAARKLAEARRHGWQLVYTLSGHSIDTPIGRAVWTPDTIVEVQDDEFGLDGKFWIESVEFRRQPQATTTLRLMRPDDVLFGSAEL